MRPSILFPLFAETRTLGGVGPKMEKLIARVAGPRIVDLIFDLPVGLIDRSYRPKLKDAESGRIATVTVTVLDHVAPRDRRQPYRIRCSDDTAVIELIFFHAHADYLNRTLPVGSQRIISGKIECYKDKLQMPHPDHVLAPEQLHELPLHEPVYALTEGLPGKTLMKAVRAAVAIVPALAEWDDPAFLKTRGWLPFDDALRAAHAPVSELDLLPDRPARQRLAYDELLANQLALLLIRRQMRSVKKGRSLKGSGKLKAKAISALPFALTDAQLHAIGEIEADMEAPQRMLRLLQGDVGAGKTIVAFLALLGAVEAGAQGALMAPTDILSRQHMASLEPLAKAAGIRMALLTGRERTGREATLAALASGEIDILVGTHALFSEDVAFADLGLAVVDEQHRFGVHQRMQLQGKGGRPADVLVMTATPIPRTLALTVYGDMDVSRLTGRPPGRKPVDHARALGRPPGRSGRASAQGHRPRRTGLLGLSAGRRVGEDRSRRRRRARLDAEARPRLKSGSGAWPHERTGARRGNGEVQVGRDLDPRCDDSYRSRRRRAGSHDHGGRTCRALRPCAASSIARARRPRKGQVELPADLSRRRWARPPRRVSKRCARPTTAS